MREGDEEEDEDEDPADGGGVAEVTGGEADGEEVHDDGEAAAGGAGALEEDVGEFEELEAGDGTDEDHVGEDGANAGECDVEEGLEGASAVDGGGFVKLWIDGLESGEEVDHAVTDGEPEGGDEDGGHGEVRAGEPGDGDGVAGEQGEEAIEETGGAE